jgi:hypothetical protein
MVKQFLPGLVRTIVDDNLISFVHTPQMGVKDKRFYSSSSFPFDVSWLVEYEYISLKLRTPSFPFISRSYGPTS